MDEQQLSILKLVKCAGVSHLSEECLLLLSKKITEKTTMIIQRTHQLCSKNKTRINNEDLYHTFDSLGYNIAKSSILQNITKQH